MNSGAVQEWRDYVWTLKHRTERAEKQAEEVEKRTEGRITGWLRREAAKIIGESMGGECLEDRCDAAAEALELAADMIEKGEYTE